MEKAGLIDTILDPAMTLELYWGQLLKDYPTHPLVSSRDCWKEANPMQLYGDEATVMKESWMLASWSLELSRNRTNSLQSRMMLYSFPASYYAMADGVNLSLQALNDVIVKRFNQMGAEGLSVSFPDGDKLCRFYIVSLKGDWKYLKQSLNLVRHYNTEEAALIHIVRVPLLSGLIPRPRC